MTPLSAREFVPAWLTSMTPSSLEATLSLSLETVAFDTQVCRAQVPRHGARDHPAQGNTNSVALHCARYIPSPSRRFGRRGGTTCRSYARKCPVFSRAQCTGISNDESVSFAPPSDRAPAHGKNGGPCPCTGCRQRKNGNCRYRYAPGSPRLSVGAAK